MIEAWSTIQTHINHDTIYREPKWGAIISDSEPALCLLPILVFQLDTTIVSILDPDEEYEQTSMTDFGVKQHSCTYRPCGRAFRFVSVLSCDTPKSLDSFQRQIQWQHYLKKISSIHPYLNAAEACMASKIIYVISIFAPGSCSFECIRLHTWSSSSSDIISPSLGQPLISLRNLSFSRTTWISSLRSAR